MIKPLFFLSLILLPVSAATASGSPEAVVQAMFAAFNNHDAHGMEKLYANDALLSSSDFCQVRGRRDVYRTYQALFDAFPDIHDDAMTFVSQGDKVAVRFRATSQRGNTSLWIHTFLEVRNGLIVKDESIFDNAGRPCEQ